MPEVLGTDPGTGISAYGTTISGGTTGVIGMLVKVGIDGIEVDVLDVSTMNSPARYKQFIAGMKDAKQLTFDTIYEDKNTVHLLNNLGASNEIWTVTLPDASTFVCSGFIMKVSPAAGQNTDKLSGNFTIKLSGQPTFNSASGS